MKLNGLLIIFLLFSCGNRSEEKNDEDKEKNPTYSEFIDEGWSYFESESYIDALEAFNNAQKMDSTKSDGDLGIAWVHLKLKNYNHSLTSFSNGKSKNMTSADFDAGNAFANYSLKNYNASNIDINNAFQLDSNWSISRGLDLSKTDLWVLSAHNHFLLGQFSNSLEMIQKVDLSFNSDIVTYEGKLALLKKIELLNKVKF